MAQYFYEIKLDNDSFPMLSEQQTRTVISPVNSDDDEDYFPGLAYCHNVLPSKYGIDAVGYTSKIAAYSGLATGDYFSSIELIYSETLERIYLGITAVGTVYKLTPDDGPASWTLVQATGFTSNMSVGTVNGVSYIMFAGEQVYTYDSESNSLTEITLTAVDIAELNGITASYGYLVVYSDEEVAWSSTVDPTDFDPSEATGAGGGSVSNISGNINFISTTTTGMLIHADGNMVAATYTGNSSYPFKFTEVKDSKGVIGPKYVSRNNNSAYQYVYSKAGIQVVSSTSASTELAEITDFLAGQRFETYDEDTDELVITSLTSSDSVDIRINFLTSRYVIVSYGIRTGDYAEYTHALVYDSVLERVGKLLIDHVDVIDYYATQNNIAKSSIAFLGADGEIQLLDSSTSNNANGVAILGKIQATHSRRSELLGVEIENIPEDFDLSVYDRAAADGKNGINVASTGLRVDDDNVREYMFRSSAKNHSLMLKGAFNLTTLIVRYAIGARR